MAEAFVVARNPSRASALPYLVRLPLRSGALWLKTQDTWPRATRLYCHPLGSPPDPAQLEILERVPVAICERRGRAIDLILDRGNNKRAQFVFAKSRGRNVIFWQSARSARSARPGLRIPATTTPPDCAIYVDTRERYGYRFSAHHAPLVKRKLPVGDYAALDGERCIAVVERKSIDDFITSLINGSLNFAMAELAAARLAAVVVEGRYSQLLRYTFSRPGFVPQQLAHLYVRYPNVAINFLETRKIAEEWTYRFLAAAYADAQTLPLSPS